MDRVVLVGLVDLAVHRFLGDLVGLVFRGFLVRLGVRYFLGVLVGRACMVALLLIRKFVEVGRGIQGIQELRGVLVFRVFLGRQIGQALRVDNNLRNQAPDV